MPETDQEVISTGDSQGEFQTTVLKKLPTSQSQWEHKLLNSLIKNFKDMVTIFVNKNP